MKELWKTVDKYPNYKISNMGNIYSKNIKKNLKQQIGSHGYYTVNLSSNGKQKSILIHRLVAEIFLSNKKYECVNHKDGNKLNNNVDNLEKVSYRENNLHAYNSGLRERRNNKGWKHSKITVLNACFLLEKYRVIKVVRITGLSESFVRSLYAKSIYKELTSNFNFLKTKDAGGDRYNSKLTSKQAKAIRSEYAENKTSHRKLAHKYGVSKPVITNVLNYKSYK